MHISRLSHFLLGGLCACFLLSSCERPDPEVTIFTTPGSSAAIAGPVIPPSSNLAPTSTLIRPDNNPAQTTAADGPVYAGMPTPDPPHTMGDSNVAVIVHPVGPGETLGYIAQLYGVQLETLLTTNQLLSADIISVGQEILVPTAAAVVSPNFKLIPDSELVYGPAAKGFDVRNFVNAHGGYLLQYEADVEGQILAGPEIVSLVAHRFSVNPRLLLALLEYRTGWITRSLNDPPPFMLGFTTGTKSDLYNQLGALANQLNWGYYGRAEGNLPSFTISDGSRVAFAAEINHGTAGVQRALGSHSSANYAAWQEDVGPNGFFATYKRLFGNPFAYTVEPIWPDNVSQPALELPWSKGETWYYTGGPHGGWATGSAWAALDFVPPADQLGCVQSDDWVTAVAAGVVTRSGLGAVVVDLDGDGFAGTGWAITYMHLDSRDRIPVGTMVETGDPLGHPSCEGGFSNGTHLHIARTYNGRWIAADGAVPFDLGGWVSTSLGREYDGLLWYEETSKEACICREEFNAITNNR